MPFPDRRVIASLALAFGAALIPGLGSPVAAQTAKPPYQATAGAGLALAQRLCTNCHVVESSPSVAVPSGVPSFRTIANLPGQTGNRIMEKLIAPPHQMPDMQLSLNEIADLLTYLDSLRPADATPLAPDTGEGNKIRYPRPS